MELAGTISVISHSRRDDRVRPVRDVLRRAVLADEYAAGPLPSESELMEEFSASRTVIRAALELLREEGLIRRVQGAGTFSEVHWPTRNGRRLDVIIDAMAGGRGNVTLQLLSAVIVESPPSIAEALRVAPRTELLVVERLGRLAGRPTMLTTGFLPADIAVPALAMPGSLGAWPKIGEMEDRLGRVLHETAVVADSVPADSGVAQLLGCDHGQPLLLLERLLVDERECPVELSVMRCRNLRVSFFVDPQATGVPPSGLLDVNYEELNHADPS